MALELIGSCMNTALSAPKLQPAIPHKRTTPHWWVFSSVSFLLPFFPAKQILNKFNLKLCAVSSFNHQHSVTVNSVILAKKFDEFLSNFLQSPVVAQMENWVLCRIFLKKRGTKNEDDNTQSCNDNRVRKLRTTRPVFYDFMTKDRTDLNLAPSSSSSGSSGVTEVSCNESDDHEESSSCNSFPYFRRKP